MSELEKSLVPPALAIKAMRDSGYRNTAYAVAELIDNAIQAGSTGVELLCCERQFFENQRSRQNIHQIAVLDNGVGMDRDVLSDALQFGNGKYLDDRSGIGRFGMGLPSSSISQCRRVDVWSWQDGVTSAIWSYMDLDQVEAGDQTTVPYPVPKEVPLLWQQAGATFAKSGTLVVWSRLDRCLWKTANAIIKNSELIIGRMYRRFVLDKRVTIRLAAFVDDAPNQCEIDRPVLANDPQYLMVPTSTPSPYDEVAMFRPDGDAWEVDHDIEFAGSIHRVVTRFTVAKEDVRKQPQAGATLHGRHAKRNIGVSLVRSDRELELETSLVHASEARERWWGIEVDFPPALDEVFGVTNNKQSARHFTETATAIEEMLADEDSFVDLQEQMRLDEDPRGPLLDMVHLINRRLDLLRKTIELQRKGTRRRRRHETPSAEERATTVTRERQAEGHEGASDEDEQLPDDERAEALARELEDTGLTQDDAQALAARTIKQHIKYTFAEADLEGRTFFTVKIVAGEIVIKINVNHPAYSHLVEVLEDVPIDETDIDTLRSRLETANSGLKLLLMAWARFEDEATTVLEREEIQETRHKWGVMAARFLRES